MALRIVATLTAAVVLGACGYKGPLFYPGERKTGPSDSTKSATTPTHPPVPADPQLP